MIYSLDKTPDLTSHRWHFSVELIENFLGPSDWGVVANGHTLVARFKSMSDAQRKLAKLRYDQSTDPHPQPRMIGLDGVV